MVPPITRRQLVGAGAGAAIAALGLWQWLETDAPEPLALVLFGGFLCGFVAADSGHDGLEVAMARVLPVVLAGTGLWALRALDSSSADGGAVLVAFMLVVSLLLTYVPLLFLPFAGASALGGFVSGKTVGEDAGESE